MEFWDILGIAPTKNKREIKKSYATRSKLYHPEEHPQEFALLKSAYENAIAFANSDHVWTIPTDQSESNTVSQNERELNTVNENERELNTVNQNERELNTVNQNENKTSNTVNQNENKTSNTVNENEDKTSNTDHQIERELNTVNENEDKTSNTDNQLENNNRNTVNQQEHNNPNGTTSHPLDCPPETHRGTLFDEDEDEQTLFSTLSTLLIFCPKLQDNPEELRAFLFDWIFTTDFLDVFHKEAFFPQLFYVLNTLSHEDDTLYFPLPLEEALFTAYGLYFHQEGEGNYGLYVLEGMEFEGMHHLIHLLQFVQPSYSHLKGVDDHHIPVYHLLLQRSFSDYNHLKVMLKNYDDSYLAKSHLYSLFSYYTPFFINQDFTEISTKIKNDDDDDEILHHRSYTALILLTHFIKNNKCPNTFLGMIYESIDLDSDTLFTDCSFSPLYDTLRKTIKRQFSKTRYQTELKRILRLKDRFSRNFSDTFLDVPLFINKYPSLYQNAFFPTHCMENPEYLTKKKRDSLERLFRTPSEQLLHLDFIQHALYNNMIIADCSQSNLLAHPVFLDYLLAFYAPHSGEMFQEITLELEGLRHQSNLLPYYYLPQPKTPENTTFPQAFSSPFFWYYFFSVSFPAAILTREITKLDLYVKNTSLSTFLHNRFPPNLPWICAFTQYSPYKEDLEVSTQYQIFFKDDQFTFFFLENALLIKPKEGLLNRNLNLEELLDIAQGDSYHFFLLLPLLRCDDSAKVERSIREQLTTLPLPSCLLPELARFLYAHVTTYLTNDEIFDRSVNQTHAFKEAMPHLTHTTPVSFAALSHESKRILYQQVFRHPVEKDLAPLPPHLDTIPHLKDYFQQNFPLEGNSLTFTLNYCDTPTPPFLQTLELLFRNPEDIELFPFPVEDEIYAHCVKYTLGTCQFNGQPPHLFGITEDGDFFSVSYEGYFQFSPSFEDLWTASTYGSPFPLYILIETMYAPLDTTLAKIFENDLLEEFLDHF